MFKSIKYWVAFFSSQLVCALISILAVNFSLPVQMYIYLLLLAVTFIAIYFSYKRISDSYLLPIGYIVIAVFIAMFWSNHMLCQK